MGAKPDLPLTFFLVFALCKVPITVERHCGNNPKIAIIKFHKPMDSEQLPTTRYESISFTSLYCSGKFLLLHWCGCTFVRRVPVC